MTDELEKDFILPQTLSAMAKTFYVKVPKPLDKKKWYIKQGSTVTGVKVIAEGKKIRDVNYLIEKYPLPDGSYTKAEDWYKVRGTAIVTDGRAEKKEEIHWYQCKDIGKVEFKLKLWGDKNVADVQRGAHNGFNSQ